MRSLVSDRCYFAFLNSMKDDTLRFPELVAADLIREFPHLRVEEAKAIWQDWRLNRKGPRPQGVRQKDSVA